MSIAPFTRIINPCKTLTSSSPASSPVNVFAKIEFAIKDGKGRLSITGVEGPMSNGNCRGSCGQIIMGMKETPDYVASYTEGWTPEMFARFLEVWDTWHLNDMHAGTSWLFKEVPVDILEFLVGLPQATTKPYWL